MNSHLHIIRAVTNLHVGSGNANVGIIDNLIQRDVLTNFPNINSSGFKGAMRDHCKNWKQEDIKEVFGSSPNDRNDMAQGNYRFFDCRLLGIPVRTNTEQYVMATCPGLINDFLDFVNMFGMKWPENLKIKPVKEVAASWPVSGGLEVEDKLYEKIKHTSYPILPKLFGKGCKVLVFPDEELTILCDDYHLPVMARNCLETGKENLWYEQVLPRESVLFTVIQSPDEHYKFSEEMLVQIGANASIGYGFCKISELSYENRHY